jgi:hypothetical protein
LENTIRGDPTGYDSAWQSATSVHDLSVVTDLSVTDLSVTDLSSDSRQSAAPLIVPLSLGCPAISGISIRSAWVKG